jgi:hypothetical protein
MKSFVAIICLAIFAMAVVHATEIEEDHDNTRGLNDTFKKLVLSAIAKLTPVVQKCVQKNLDANKALLGQLIACAVTGTSVSKCLTKNVKLAPCF